MKMRLFLVLLSVIFSTHLFGQVIPNADFEQWDNSLGWEEPVDWDTPNEETQAPLFGVETVEPSNDAYEGAFAAKLETKQLLTFTIPGLLTLGKYADAAVTGGIPCNQRPDKLTGYYKYLPMPDDSLMIAVYMYKHNTTTNSYDTIGFGALTSTETVNNYSLFEVDIDYYTNETPDTMNITIMPSGKTPVVGSVLYIDNLSFETDSSSVTKYKEVTICEESLIKVYPNPNNGVFNLYIDNSLSNEVTINLLDFAGKNILNKSITETDIKFNLSTISKGVYYIHIESDDYVAIEKIIIQ